MKTREQLEKDLRFEHQYANKYGWDLVGPYYYAVLEELLTLPYDNPTPVKDGKVKALVPFEYKEGRD